MNAASKALASLVLDVPVLDLYHSGVLALIEGPAINSIFLAGTESRRFRVG
jgi:hypothetical protein